MVQIKDVITQEYIDARILKCLNFSRHGHLFGDCPGKFCQRCVQLVNLCTCHVPRSLDDACILGHINFTCRACRRNDHQVNQCPGLKRCGSCGFLGHTAHGKQRHWPRYQWQPISAYGPPGFTAKVDEISPICSHKQNRGNHNTQGENRRAV